MLKDRIYKKRKKPGLLPVLLGVIKAIVAAGLFLVRIAFSKLRSTYEK